MLTEELTVVGGHDEHRVIVKTQPLDSFEQTTDMMVHVTDLGIVETRQIVFVELGPWGRRTLIKELIRVRLGR
jgi:hypothetical protein